MRLALACMVLVGCESVPVVHFVIRESLVPTPTRFAEERAGDDVVASPASPISNAIVLRPADDCTLDLAELAARIRDDPQLTDRMHPRIGQGGDGAWAMRTSSAGTADYSELRLFWWFIPPGKVERRFYVWADGYEPRTVTIELGTANSRVDVPLTRAQPR